MLLIRRFEELVQSLFLRGEVYGTTHLYSGQEAVAVGFASALARRRPRRVHVPRPRAPARARDWRRRRCSPSCSAGRPGVNGGRAGSMNIVDPDHGVIGCFGIVGGSIAAATGAALALKGTGRSRSRSSATARRTRRTSSSASTSPRCSTCPSCSSARTTATASTRRWTPSPAGTIVGPGRGDGDSRASWSTGWTSGRSARPRSRRVERVRERRAGPSSSRRGRTGSSATPAAIRASTARRASSSEWQRARSARSSPSGGCRPSTASRPTQLREVADDVERELDEVEAGGARGAVPRAAAVPGVQGVSGRSREHADRRASASWPKPARGDPQPNGTRALAARRAAARGARPARPEPARARAAARGLAQPRLADRDGEDPAVRPHALRDRQRARRLARRAVRAADGEPDGAPATPRSAGRPPSRRDRPPTGTAASSAPTSGA